MIQHKLNKMRLTHRFVRPRFLLLNSPVPPAPRPAQPAPALPVAAGGGQEPDS
jgi:hypothetical protein